MGLDFYIGKTFDSLQEEYGVVTLEEECNENIFQIKDFFSINIGMIINIDPYGEKEFLEEELEELENISNIVISEIDMIKAKFDKRSYKNESIEEIKDFFFKLSKLIKIAKNEKKRIIVIGD